MRSGNEVGEIVGFFPASNERYLGNNIERFESLCSCIFIALNCTAHRPTDSTVTISVDNMPTNHSLSIVYAEMWRCPIGDNSAIQCPSGRCVF